MIGFADLSDIYVQRLHSRKGHTKLGANSTGFMEEFKQIQTMEDTVYVPKLVRQKAFFDSIEGVDSWIAKG